MAVVTGYTAGYLQGVLDATVTDGAINESGHLILTTKDGTPIDLGSIAAAVGPASLTASGIVELATTAETTAGTDSTRAVTPAGMATVISSKQPVDDDLTAIANIAPANDDLIQRKSGIWVNRTLAQVGTDLIATSSLASSATQKGFVELATDAEVATGTDTTRAVTPASLAALIATATIRGLVELATDAEALTGTDTTRATTPANLKPIFDAKQPIDSDLTAIAAIAPANDDVIQRKSGAWINRTMVQLLADVKALPLLGGTMTGTTTGSLSATTTAMVAALIAGDTFDRVRLYVDGLEMGSGAAAREMKLAWMSTGVMGINGADLRFGTLGKGLRLSEGTNGRMGIAALTAGTATVSNTSVTAGTRIWLTCNNPAGTPGFLRVSARTAGTSFTITSSSGTDTSSVAWLMIEPS